MLKLAHGNQDQKRSGEARLPEYGPTLIPKLGRVTRD
jgi:hypothetical protein